MACAQRIWGLFPSDPIPDDERAHFWIERLESILDHGLLVSSEWQGRLLEQRRILRELQGERENMDDRVLEKLEDRWLKVPRWRRAIILAAQWVQFKFTPKDF
jgi:hypothetical protein